MLIGVMDNELGFADSAQSYDCGSGRRTAIPETGLNFSQYLLPSRKIRIIAVGKITNRLVPGFMSRRN